MSTTDLHANIFTEEIKNLMSYMKIKMLSLKFKDYVDKTVMILFKYA